MSNITKRLLAYEGEEWETTACYNGLRLEAADNIFLLRSAISNLLTRIDDSPSEEIRTFGELDDLRDTLAAGEWTSDSERASDKQTGEE